jgi:hypothetical protein
MNPAPNLPIPDQDQDQEQEKSGLRVPRVMNFYALRQQALATALTTAGEGGATAFGAHARTKSVLVFAGALRAL